MKISIGKQSNTNLITMSLEYTFILTNEKQMIVLSNPIILDTVKFSAMQKTNVIYSRRRYIQISAIQQYSYTTDYTSKQNNSLHECIKNNTNGF